MFQPGFQHAWIRHGTGFNDNDKPGRWIVYPDTDDAPELWTVVRLDLEYDRERVVWCLDAVERFERGDVVQGYTEAGYGAGHLACRLGLADPTDTSGRASLRPRQDDKVLLLRWSAEGRLDPAGHLGHRAGNAGGRHMPRNGDTGSAVVELQRRLVLWGAPLTADGFFGYLTETWVTRFQDWKGLTPDGIVGPATSDALAGTPDGVIPDLSTTLQRGDNGRGVMALQERLIAWGAPIAADSDYGPLTETWVTRFQELKGLTADGVAGRTTLSTLAFHPDAQLDEPGSTLRRGDSGPGVVAAQERLIAWGAPIAADGDFGPITETWVTRFQHWRGLTTDGVIGPATSQALAAAPDGTIPDLSETIRRGDRGSGVAATQERLIAWGAPIAADGDFGPITETWVIRFQRWKGLGADGVVGPATLSALAFHPDGQIPDAATTVQRGDRGRAVVEVQERLVAWGAAIAADGIFGAITESWVVAFQEWRGLFADGIVGPVTREALMATPDGTIPPPDPDDRDRPPPDPVGAYTARAATELASHEGFVREAYKDSEGNWTWSIGITSFSGIDVLQYRDNPQSLETCFEAYRMILVNRYVPGVLAAFDRYPLTEEELAAAVSFHYNTGSIATADWVRQVKAGNPSAARQSIMNWRSPEAVIPRRRRERDLFFDGVWSSDGTATEYPVKKPSYTPDFARGVHIDVLPTMELLFPSDPTPEPIDPPPTPPPAPTTQRFVTATSLNVRSSPEVGPSNRIGSLRLAAPVEVVADAEVDGWVEVECVADWLIAGPDRRRGFVASAFLRTPASEAAERLVAAARREWVRFDYGTGQETDGPYYRYVGEMWRALGKNYDGRNLDQPWSAAAISFVVRNAAPGYDGFQYSAGHWRYINDAIADRELDRDGPFLGYRIHEQKPTVGDLVGKWRNVRITYDEAFRRSQRAAAASQAYESHTDLVVAVGQDHVITMGGNVADSFSLNTYPLTPGGYLEDAESVFTILKNTAS